ncbi:LysR family transcriptional regulator [Limnohabitans sp.]|uniref:LysR family transcriptional regulator n=1 Tax=Limnohabitans sp. TaxID=1907725 RepID=UPI0025BA56C4|nr:LysR family transcriptional regulator [Limnohabitans sp.]
MHYDLTDLRLFFHVGEQLNLTRAAEKCFLSVPSASLRIKQLEENFQTPLMLRQAKGLQLTQAGEAMANHAKLVLQQLEVMHADLRPYALGVKGRIRLQANSTATNTFLAKALSAFLNDNPDIDIDLEELPSRDIISSVAKGAADLGIVAGSVDADKIDVVPLYADELVVICHSGAGIAKQLSVKLSDILEDYRFVGLNQFNSIQSFLDRQAQNIGKRVNLRIQVGNYENVCQMAAVGVGIAIVPRAIALGHAKSSGLHIIALDDPWARRQISLVKQQQRMLPKFSEDLIHHLRLAASQAPTSAIKPA